MSPSEALCRCVTGSWEKVVIKPVTDDRNRNFGFIAENKLYRNSGRLVGKMSGNLVISDSGKPLGEVNNGTVTMYGRATLRSRLVGRVRSMVFRPEEPAAGAHKTPEA